MSIPFNKPFVVGKELYYIAKAVAFGNIAADGYFTKSCSEFLAHRFCINKVLMTPSCTAALEMAAILCEIGPGDEVILPSYTFSSTANAFVCLGAKPVFIDICQETLNIDVGQLEQAITPNTKAIVPVHYAGVGCEMDTIMAIAEQHKLWVIEDAAQGVNSFYKGRGLGSIGHLAAFSFHETKNYICGEGGALCINSPEFIERAHIIRDKGTNRQQFLNGQVDKYTWVDIGSSYVPSEISCAFLLAQFEMLQEIADKRKALYEYYASALKPLEDEGFLRLPVIPIDCKINYHMFYILLPDQMIRDALIAYLKKHDIHAIFHYVPLHTSPMGQKFGFHYGALPVTENISQRLLRLPFYFDITEEEQKQVSSKIMDFLTNDNL